MTNNEQIRRDNLAIDISEDADSIRLEWRGRSTDREPGIFLLPHLERIMERCAAGKRSLILDFRNMEYMNSSTITPISKVLELGKEGNLAIRLIYDRKTKWQELCFSALRIFETEDKRIVVAGQ